MSEEVVNDIVKAAQKKAAGVVYLSLLFGLLNIGGALLFVRQTLQLKAEKAALEFNDKNYKAEELHSGKTFKIVKGACVSFFGSDGIGGCDQEYQLVDLSDHDARIIAILTHHATR